MLISIKGLFKLNAKVRGLETQTCSNLADIKELFWSEVMNKILLEYKKTAFADRPSENRIRFICVRHTLKHTTHKLTTIHVKKANRCALQCSLNVAIEKNPSLFHYSACPLYLNTRLFQMTKSRYK